MRPFVVIVTIALLLAGCSQQTETFAQNRDEATTPSLNNALGVDAASFVEGNLYFLGYHELGHALVSELDLPVVGREEDAVDRLAIWMMTPEEGEGTHLFFRWREFWGTPAAFRGRYAGNEANQPRLAGLSLFHIAEKTQVELAEGETTPDGLGDCQ
jgi:hypothetical protein